MGSVTRLYHVEDVQLDGDRMQLLVADLGRPGAERVIARAMEEIAVRLTRIENAYSDGALDRVAKGARGLAALADQTGMATVRDIALAVARLATSTDATALGALVARLVRVGEMSLVSASDVHDVSV